MKPIPATVAILLAALMILAPSPADAQSAGTGGVVPAPEARQSPLALASSTIDGTYIKVVYGSPRMRGRSIFGRTRPGC